MSALLKKFLLGIEVPRLFCEAGIKAESKINPEGRRPKIAIKKAEHHAPLFLSTGL